MTAPEAESPSTATEAALEVLDSATLLMVNMAAVTRLPEAGKALQTLIGCRLVELLEIYIRRILELIFTHDQAAWSGRTKVKLSVADVLQTAREDLLQRAREDDAVQLAGKFEDTQKLLTAYLKTPPFTPELLNLFLSLKDVRNLLVHNNGLVDRAYAEKHPDMQVGQRLDNPATVMLSAFAMLDSVKRIDALVVTRYPELGVKVGAANEKMLDRLQQSMTLIEATPEEGQLVMAGIRALKASNPEMAALMPSGMGFGFRTFWSVGPVDGGWAALGGDKRVLTGFESEASALAWLEEGQLSWKGCTFSDESDATWAYGQLANGLVFKWPQAEVGVPITIPPA